MQVIWERREATARDIQTALPGDRHYNSVLTIVRVLEKKGHLVHREDGRSHVYRAAESREKARKGVLGYVVKQVFGGSAASLVLNLVEAGDLTMSDLEEIRKQIDEKTASVKKKKGAKK